jgi:NAD(P)-dependent dehydrogenase (short-subunit alcohol dehydrogenase family)
METRKVALITGANRGLGLETARRIGKTGISVLVTARKQSDAHHAEVTLRAEGVDAHALELDVTKSSDIERARALIEARFQKLDILVNNAGIHLDGAWFGNTTSSVSIGALHETFETNFFAVVELTRALLPLIKKSQAGRIVNVSSVMASLAMHADKTSMIYSAKPFAYDASKAALNSFTLHLAHELRDTHVRVNSAHPGWVRTSMGGTDAAMSVEEGASTIVNLALAGADSPHGVFLHLGSALPW